MGNKNVNKKEINKKDIINKSFTLCPLIKDRKLIIEKTVYGNTISCLGIINYNNKDFILLGFDYGKFKIFDSKTLETIIEEHNEINTNEYIRYVAQLNRENFVIVSDHYIRIYVFYLDNISSNISEERYNIKLLQKFNKVSKKRHIKTINLNPHFSKAFIFDRNLYKEYDIYEKQQIKNKEKNNNCNKIELFEEELIVSSKYGIFIYEKNILENNDKNHNEKKDYLNNNVNDEENNKFDI